MQCFRGPHPSKALQRRAFNNRLSNSRNLPVLDDNIPLCLPSSTRSIENDPRPCISSLPADLITSKSPLNVSSNMTLCTDPIKTNVPGCIQPCIFIAPSSQLDLYGIDSPFQSLIGSYLTMSYPNSSMRTGSNFLTLRHVPCSTLNSDSLDPLRQSSSAVCYDCAGDPSKPLNPVRTLLAYSGGDQNGFFGIKLGVHRI